LLPWRIWSCHQVPVFSFTPAHSVKSRQANLLQAGSARATSDRDVNREVNGGQVDAPAQFAGTYRVSDVFMADVNGFTRKSKFAPPHRSKTRFCASSMDSDECSGKSIPSPPGAESLLF